MKGALQRNFTLLGTVLLICACQVPMETAELANSDQQKDLLLGRLSIRLSDNWRMEETKASNESLYWLRNGRNAVVLQIGDIIRTTEKLDPDSNLKAIFSDRRVPGVISNNRNAKFIYAMKPVEAGDSLYIYMEDTIALKYYHFDGHFVNAELRDGFMDAMRASELKR